MGKLSERVDVIANIMVIAMILVAGTVIIQRYYFSPPIQEKTTERVKPTVGAKLDLADLNWSENPKTLIMALQPSCRFCNESVPFYKRLVDAMKDKNVKLVVVFPKDIDRGKAYLTESGLNISQVYQSPLNKLQVSGTPTLILTNDKGEVTNFWVGKLNSEKEAEVLDKLSL
jgi:thioredoxin-related protein